MHCIEDASGASSSGRLVRTTCSVTQCSMAIEVVSAPLISPLQDVCKSCSTIRLQFLGLSARRTCGLAVVGLSARTTSRRLCQCSQVPALLEDMEKVISTIAISIHFLLPHQLPISKIFHRILDSHAARHAIHRPHLAPRHGLWVLFMRFRSVIAVLFAGRSSSSNSPFFRFRPLCIAPASSADAAAVSSGPAACAPAVCSSCGCSGCC